MTKENTLLPGFSPPTTEKKSAFARRIGVSPGRITQLIAKGLPVRDDGALDIAAALAWVDQHLDQSRRLAAKTRPDGMGEDAAGPISVRVEHERIKMERSRLALEQERGDLVDRATAERVIFSRAKAERDAHLAWVMRVAPLLAGEVGADPGAVHRVLDREMRDHLRDLSRTPLEALTHDG